MEPSVDESDSKYGSNTVHPYDRSTALVYSTNQLSTQMTQELLYVTLSVVLGSSLLTLIVVMFVCACRQRQRQRILGCHASLLYCVQPAYRRMQAVCICKWGRLHWIIVCHCRCRRRNAASWRPAYDHMQAAYDDKMQAACIASGAPALVTNLHITADIFCTSVALWWLINFLIMLL